MPFDLVFSTLAALALLLTLPGSLYLAWLTAGALRWRPRPPASSLRGTLTLLVPAHDEAAGIARTLGRLLDAARADRDTRIVVVADNCSDATARIARELGATVLERFDATRRGKGYALDFAFGQLSDADWIVVIDADSEPAAGFLPAQRRAIGQGADALQCRYTVRDPARSQRTRLQQVALYAWNITRPRGRAGWGCSAGILGNGFALSRATRERVPYTAASVVEDCEYHIRLLEAGLKVSWVDDAEVLGEMPATASAAKGQRARWEGGRLALLRDLGPTLLRGAARRPATLEALADLCLLPLAFHVALLLLALGSPWPTLAAAGIAVVAIHLLVALRIGRATRGEWLALAGAPLYLIWKLSVFARILRAARRGAAWERTQRSS